MSGTDELDAIRERKRQELLEGGGESIDAGAEAGPDEFLFVKEEADLERLTGRYDVVLVDFYADWCGPCQMMEPILGEVARETPAAVVKVDVDAHTFLAQQNGVQGVPTLVVYADGEPVKRMVGVQDAGTLRSLIDRFGS